GGGSRVIRATYSAGWTLDEISSDITGAPATSFTPGDPDAIYYDREDEDGRQLTRAVHSGGDWTITGLTTGAHFSGAMNGPHRVVDGADIDIIWFWGRWYDSDRDFAYGH